MTVIAAVLAAALVAVVVAFLRHIASLERAWSEERRELLTRIQRPEHVPTGPSAPFLFPDPEPDDMQLVGTIHYEPEGD